MLSKEKKTSEGIGFGCDDKEINCKQMNVINHKAKTSNAITTG